MKSIDSPRTTSTHALWPNHRRRSAPHRQPAVRASNGKSRPGKHILLVDDDPVAPDSLTDALVAEGYFVIPAANGRELLAFASKLPVDLALLDLDLPVNSGRKTLKRFICEHPLTPTIIATAHPDRFSAALGTGPGALLAKPMDIPKLRRTIAKLLAEAARQRLPHPAVKKNEFHHNPATASHNHHRPARHR